VRRRGKFVVFELTRDRVAVNAMLTGRFQLAAPSVKRPPSTAVVLAFGPRSRPPRDRAAWTRAAAWLPPDADPAELRYRDPSQMGKVYLLPAGVARAVTGLDDAGQGPDADDPELTLEDWRARIRRHPGELKSLLRNQAFVAGIGNAYSDEILHAARLSPFRKRALARAIDVLQDRVPPTFEKQVRDFLAVHLKGGEPCPRCGTRLSEVSSRSEATTWCRGCQR
jgi:formamidopyrimidine-DNA glycosylase